MIPPDFLYQLQNIGVALWAVWQLLFVLWFAWSLLKPNKIKPEEAFHVRLLDYSQGPQQLPIASWYLRYPRFIHAEMMTHKDFSRSAASSRAIPVKKMLEQVWNNPAMPLNFGYNRPGMQSTEYMSGFMLNLMRNLWQLAGRLVCCVVWVMMKLNVHKQFANRLIEPWQMMHVTLTTNKMANFFNLRIHKDAQPEICFLAKLMRESIMWQRPRKLRIGDYHLPWIEIDRDYDLAYEYLKKGRITRDEPKEAEINLLLVKMSAARCARSSYANFDNIISVESDLSTYAKLVESAPVHASPCEHQATPDEKQNVRIFIEGDDVTPAIVTTQWKQAKLHGNLTGYIVFRNTILGHYVHDKLPAAVA